MTAPEWARTLASRYGAQFGVPEGLLLALWWVESGWDPQAVGDGGCSVGLGQLNFCGGAGTTFAQRDGVTREQVLASPDLQARYSAEYLAGCFWRWGDWARAVSCYNCPACAPDLSNRAYVDRVMAAWREVSGGTGEGGVVLPGLSSPAAQALVFIGLLAVLVGLDILL